MIDKVFSVLFGTKHERDIKRLKPIVDRINAQEKELLTLTLDEIKQRSLKLRSDVAEGKGLDEILPEAFSLVRETSRRIMGMRHFDVQLMGGIVLHEGKISEMKTGEGKTLMATLPVYLNALSGKGVHVVTVNDYLARRDAEWMKPIYQTLGLTVGVIQHNMDHSARQHSYSCDITYGTNNEFGFDYLRDNMVEHKSLRVQRELNYCIVDEVDSILIDEARTPLIISGSIAESTKKYYDIDKIIPSLITGTDYEVNEKDRVVLLTEQGVHHVEKLLKIDNMYDNRNIEIVHHVNQALKAHTLFTRDVDYIVENGQVIIIDEFTGRKMEGRRYSDGLHQALEAKENVTIARESQTLASITFQNFFRMYKKLSGMTGTADTEAVEFNGIYKLDVVVIPTNKPMIRSDMPDKVYKTEREKFAAIVKDIKERSSAGQPILVGTISIEKSEEISNMLKHNGISHNVLNAKYHEKEAIIVAEAGRPGMVTIATNMAGRGTDIVLGGKKLFITEMEQHTAVHDVKLWENFKVLVLSDKYEEAGKMSEEMLGQDRDKAKKIISQGEEWLINHNKVVEAGGLYILGTERHEARRIDNQLRGRSGRQGDPGLSRFYLSLEDNLMRIFGSERIKGLMDRLGMEDGQEIESKMVSKAIASAQKRVEGRNYEIRKHLLEYDDVMNSQREYIYGLRNEILFSEDISNIVDGYLFDVAQCAIDQHSEGRNMPEEWNYMGLLNFLKSKYLTELKYDKESIRKINANDFSDRLIEEIKKQYTEKEKRIGTAHMRVLERLISLQVIDAKWREHLLQMDELRDGIWTTGLAQKQPLTEYKIRGFKIFEEMLISMKQEIVEFLMKVQIREELLSDLVPSENRTVGEEYHGEIEQFGSGGGIPMSSVPAKRNLNKKPKEEKPVIGGVDRKKTRRSRR